MKRLFFLLSLLFLFCDAYSQWNVQYTTQILKQGPDTLKISLQVRWTGAGGQDFTINQGTIRVRWSFASFPNIRSLTAISGCVTFTGPTTAKGYTSSIIQKIAVGGDSAYLISPLALSQAMNFSRYSTPEKLIASQEADSGFVCVH